MNSRQVEILSTLKESDSPITLSEMAKRFGVSLRTIQNDMKSINTEMQQSNIQLIHNQNKEGVFMQPSEVELKKLDRLLYGFDSHSSILSPDERSELLFNIFVFHQDHITLSALSDQLNVSRNTVLNDLNRLRKSMENLPIKLISSSHYGIKLAGDEIAIRESAIDYFMENASAACLSDVEHYYKVSICNRFYPVKSLEETRLVYKSLQDMAASINNHLTGNSFLLMISYIELTLERIKMNKFVSISPFQMESIYGTYEFKAMYRLISELSKELGMTIPIEEVGFLTFKLFGSDMINSSMHINENYAEIQIVVCGLIQNIANELGIDFSRDISIYHDLVCHIRPAIYRMKYNVLQKNPLINEIHSNHQNVYDAVAKNISMIEKMTNSIMSDDEIGYIALHFISIIEKRRSTTITIPNVLIVCESGIGTSNLLANRLMALYDVNVVDTIALYELENALKRSNVNYVISTLKLKSCDRIVIRVSPFINENDVVQLDKYFRRQRRKLELDEEKFLQILEQDCKILNKEHLLRNLSKEFSLAFHSTNRKEEQLMLKDVISKDLIELDFHASNWEEAVRQAGKLLLDSDCIEQSYIESMVNTVKTMGSYIVISKGIALPHSRSGEGAHKIGICVLRLDEPVEFGHRENDPVDLLFGLSSTDNKSHLGVLKDLASLLTEEKNIAYIRNAKSIDDIYDLMITKGGDK